jgi:hypothetical protein
VKRIASVLVAAGLLAGAYFYLSDAPGWRTPPNATPNGDASQVLASPFVMFRTLAPAERSGRVAMVPALTPETTRVFTKLSCARVHYAGGAGICLVEEPQGNQVVHAAYFFDRTLTHGKRLILAGVPTRARISPDGRRAAITVYGEEEMPGGGERLATNTVLVDLSNGSVFARLREFALEGPGQPAADAALDYSSVAFGTDTDRFFATLSTTSNWYIVSGSLGARRLTIVAEGLASEALSPDGARLAVKRRVGERGFWQAMVFDVATKAVEPLRHARSIDDQIEWLDRDHIAYHDATERGTGIWALAIDGRSEPRLLIPDAYSPAVQH